MVGIISDKVGYWRVIFLGLLASMLFAPIIALASLFWLLLGGICLYAMAASTMMAPCLPKLAELVEKEQNQNYGQSFGLVNAAYSIGLLLGPSVGGMVAQAFSFLAAICIYCLLYTSRCV